jgi:hypothetical protein
VIRVIRNAEGLMLEIGPFIDGEAAARFSETLSELGREGRLLELGGAGLDMVLLAILDAERDLGERAGAYELEVTAGTDGDRTVLSKRARMYRRKRQREPWDRP